MAASATNIQAKEGGTWRTITQISGKEAGVWQTVQEVWAKEGGTWRHSWINSDPQTYTWEADNTQTYRGNNNKRSTTYLYQGDGWQAGSTYGEHKGFMEFDYSDIQSKLAVRPVTSLIRLRLYSEHFYKGEGNNPIGETRHGTHNQTSEPATWSDSYEVHQWTHATRGKSHDWPGGPGSRDQEQWITLPNPVADDLRDDVIKGLTLYARDDSTSFWYCYFHGHTASSTLRPKLEITADYS